MKFIKKIIVDAKKQKIVVVQKSLQKSPSIPTIEVIECKTQFIDDKIFEYDMIQRAREAETLLTEILTNYENGEPSKLHVTMETLLSKFKTNKSNSKQQDVPKIQVIESPKDDKTMDYDKFFQQANQAQILLEEFLSNCECSSDESGEESLSSSDEDKVDSTNKCPKLHRGTPTKRMAFKGRGFSLENKCQHKKRKIVLELANVLPTLRKFNQKNYCENSGLEGKFTAMEV